jgi:Prephenate dehydratase
MNIDELREEINAIDAEMVDVFVRRMRVASEIAQYKKGANMPVFDGGREREVLTKAANLAGEEFDNYARILYSTLFNVSRSYQHEKIGTGGTSPLADEIANGVESTEKLFPERAVVACQGTEGAYSHYACEKIFSAPSIMYMSTFEGVFSAVDSGLCRYGILPLENSTSGSVNRVYDLMAKHRTHIVRSIRLRVNHSLLAKKGAKMSDITEIMSHEQALNQCSEFLKNHPKIKVTPCENTAVAAKMVAESGRTDIAAIAGGECADMYSLSALPENPQNSDNNYTRFICISKKLEIYPGADRTSLVVTLPHKPGALYHIISKFYVLGMNLVKLESRPIPGSDFEFMFYFDIDASVYSPKLARLICELESESDGFRYLGSYSETI